MIVREARFRARMDARGVALRSRIGLMLQGLGVAALAAIVYFAFLSPNDSGPLTGIDVEPPTEQPPKQQTARRNKRSPRPDRPRRRAAQATSPAAIPTGTPPTTIAPPVDSPVGSQYTSTVARILNRIAPATP